MTDIKDEIIKYIDKENDYLEDRLLTRLQTIEKFIENIERSISSLDSRTYNDAQLREIASQESAKVLKKFWSNFKWFIGLTLGSVAIMLTAGIITWADVRDYREFKKAVNAHIIESTNRINTIERCQLTHDLKTDIGDIKDSIKIIEAK